MSPLVGLGWNATAGPYAYSEHLEPDEWGYNAREDSKGIIAIELAEPNLRDGIPDSVVEGAAAYIVDAVHIVYPFLGLEEDDYVEHWELLAGKRDGKTDVAPYNPGALAKRMTAAVRRLAK
jgi:hypothetical protein